MIKYVYKKMYLHFFKSDKHLQKNGVTYTQEMNQTFASHLALLLFFYTRGYSTIKFSQNGQNLDPLPLVCTCFGKPYLRERSKL